MFGRASEFGASFDLATLDGTNGFRLEASTQIDYSGSSVAAAGDVNGDGFGDVIIGAPFADPGGVYAAGESYVVFGRASGFGASLTLRPSTAPTAFASTASIARRQSGFSVAGAGDVNGDGFGDLIIGAPALTDGCGESYVVFGEASGFEASLDLASLDGTNGFRLDGIDAAQRQLRRRGRGRQRRRLRRSHHRRWRR